MKKTLSLFLITVLLLTVAVVSFTACGLFKDITPDEAKKNLESAGYKVTITSGAEYVQREDAYMIFAESELETYLYAVKGSDVIHMFFFSSVDAASMSNDHLFDPDLYEGQNNKVVYLATKQARKDAKL